MKVTITFNLNEQGQRALLAAGGDGKTHQQSTFDINNGDLALFKIASDGSLVSRSASETAVRNTWGGGWKEYTWDNMPSPADLLVYLRKLDADREVLYAQERAENEAKATSEAQEKERKIQVALEEVRAILDGTRKDSLRGYYTDREYVSDADCCTVKADTYDEVAQLCARRKAERETREQKDARLKKIREAAEYANIRPTTLGTDGKYTFECPDASTEKTWAKHLFDIDDSQRGGFAFVGDWMTPQSRYSLPLGDLIVVGGKEWSGSRKHGEWVVECHLYIVTPAGLRQKASNTNQAITVAKKLFAQSIDERIKDTLEAVIKTCDEKITNLAALDKSEFAAELEKISKRAASWSELKALCKKALAGGAGDAKITDIDSAAQAIISAGFRELSKVHHPDAGGPAETMVLLNQAKAQLREMLKLAGEAVRS